MEVHQSIRISSVLSNAEALARYVEGFAAASAKWEFPEEQSREYQQMLGEPACCVVCEQPGCELAAVHFAEDGAKALSLTNIVPLTQPHLSTQQYNAVAQAFVRDLRAQVRADKAPIRLKLSRAELRLADVVTGKIPSKLFKRYLAGYPLSSHPNDTKRLDQFICSIARYSRKLFDLDAFQHLLCEEVGWPSQEAKACRQRVEIGLEVLKTNRHF